MVEDDEFIAELFERAAGDGPNATEALARVQPRIRRAHRRRAVLRGSAGLVVLVVLGSLVSRTTHQPSERVHVGDAGTTVPIDSSATSAAPSTTVPHVAEPQTPPAAPVTTVNANPAQSASGEAAAAPHSSPAPSASEAPAAGAKPPSKLPAGAPTTPAPAPAAGAPPASAPPPQVTSFDGQGGTVEVKYTDTSMDIASVSPSPGWSVADTKSDGASIEVKFESGDGSATGIEVHLDAGGKPIVDTPIDPVDDVGNALTGS
jgi:hypothetical protein